MSSEAGICGQIPATGVGGSDVGLGLSAIASAIGVVDGATTPRIVDGPQEVGPSVTAHRTARPNERGSDRETRNAHRMVREARAVLYALDRFCRTWCVRQTAAALTSHPSSCCAGCRQRQRHPASELGTRFRCTRSGHLPSHAGRRPGAGPRRASRRSVRRPAS